MKAMNYLSLMAIGMLLLSGLGQDLQAQEKAKDVFVVVEEMPKFKEGGIEEFRNWVMTQVKYPEEALKKGVSGKVYAEFIVTSEGKLEKIKVIKSPDELLSEEVTRVLKTSPDWKPGKQKNKAVDVSMTIPVIFKLDEGAKKTSEVEK